MDSSYGRLPLQHSPGDSAQAERGHLLLEVNSSPGLEGIETVAGKDRPGQMIQDVERRLVWVRSCSTTALVAS